MRKKVMALILAALIVCTLFAFPASAAPQILPDGGSSSNSGVPVVVGYSSGGTNGKVYYTCGVSISTGTMDTATVWTDSSVNMGNRLFISFSVVGTDGAKETNAYQSSSSTLKYYSRYVSDAAEYYKEATAGYSITLTGYGSWNCGTRYSV